MKKCVVLDGANLQKSKKELDGARVATVCTHLARGKCDESFEISFVGLSKSLDVFCPVIRAVSELFPSPRQPLATEICE